MPADLLKSIESHIDSVKHWLKSAQPDTEVQRVVLRQLAIIDYLKTELERAR